MHKNSYSKMKWFKENYLDNGKNLSILDVGSIDSSNEFVYRNIFDEENWDYELLSNKAHSNVDIVVSDIYNWYEIEDDSYDVVVSSHFFEHLKFFWLTLSQIERVLKPGGIVCIIVPSTGGKHDYDLDNCYRFHTGGLQSLAEYIGFEIDYALIDENPDSKPYYEGCLIASKPVK